METITPLLEKTQQSAAKLRALSDGQKKELLVKIADLLEGNKGLIISENKKDLERMDDANPKKDRLLLNEKRIDGLIEALNDVANLGDPSGKVLSSVVMENGLLIEKISVPMGVVGIIFESRPNVTVDVAALCIRSGNAVVLRGGSDAEYSNICLVDLIHKALDSMNLPHEIVTLLPTDRKHVQELLEAVKYVDIIIPRGSQELIDFVRKHAKVPTIETGAGVCHTYVTKDANLEKAAAIVVNAKVSRPSVCNALDTVLVDKEVAEKFLPSLIPGFTEYGVEVFADEISYEILKKAGYSNLQRAQESDFGREFLDFKCSIKVVAGLDEALNHIQKYSSRHSEAIISENALDVARFLNEVDAAAVYSNASTRFTDGGCFGLGAEIGISTQKLHARGPFALEKLVTEKWVIKGNGQIR